MFCFLFPKSKFVRQSCKRAKCICWKIKSKTPALFCLAFCLWLAFILCTAELRAVTSRPELLRAYDEAIFIFTVYSFDSRLHENISSSSYWFVSALHYETVFGLAVRVPQHSVYCPQSGPRTGLPLATVEGLARQKISRGKCHPQLLFIYLLIIHMPFLCFKSVVIHHVLSL